MHMDHDHISGGCAGSCGSCSSGCANSPREKAEALMKYVAAHNAAYIRELLSVAEQFRAMGDVIAYQQIMAAVSDYEKGSMRLTAVVNSMNIQ